MTQTNLTPTTQECGHAGPRSMFVFHSAVNDGDCVWCGVIVLIDTQTIWMSRLGCPRVKNKGSQCSLVCLCVSY
ncbi:hypothetical protein AAFF_G00167710 [Aldrovandia affinis]|uniref:Uncharacterized protein n=1 Tax=Aldrovandia affinis TaxID=143900 RepID=A0AAD7W7W7_9TELE|nr:hypothetical protein AAFF_G00167710 [Aldrovandia affinis]